eukprot:6492100-Amphidinium_carterae.1
MDARIVIQQVDNSHDWWGNHDLTTFAEHSPRSHSTHATHCHAQERPNMENLLMQAIDQIPEPSGHIAGPLFLGHQLSSQVIIALGSHHDHSWPDNHGGHNTPSGAMTNGWQPMANSTDVHSRTQGRTKCPGQAQAV